MEHRRAAPLEQLGLLRPPPVGCDADDESLEGK
jgi:hypothetical protein